MDDRLIVIIIVTISLLIIMQPWRRKKERIEVYMKTKQGRIVKKNYIHPLAKASVNANKRFREFGLMMTKKFSVKAIDVLKEVKRLNDAIEKGDEVRVIDELLDLDDVFKVVDVDASKITLGPMEAINIKVYGMTKAGKCNNILKKCMKKDC